MIRHNMRQRPKLKEDYGIDIHQEYDKLDQQFDLDEREGYSYSEAYQSKKSDDLEPPEYNPFNDLPLPLTHRNRYNTKEKDLFSQLDSSSPKFFYTPPHVRIGIVIVLTFLAIITRFYNLSEPSFVTFDEVHFGGFTNHYIHGTYFFDVHPPLGKLMYAAVAYLAGYDGTFSFKAIGMTYKDQDVPYIALRLLPATCGALMVPMAYLSVSQMGFSIFGSSLAAMMVLLELAFITQTRFILLDGPLLIFIVMTLFACIKHHNQRDRPFSKWWWIWLSLTGFFMGCALSVKWVGLFTVAFIGLNTIADLWNLLGDLKNSLITVYFHFCARALCLILLPLAVYFFCYYIHFSVLTKSGPGNGFMSRKFRDGLWTVKNTDLAASLHSGAQLTIKGELKDLYLHSHNSLYPIAGSSFQQQITGYSAKDHNNFFTIHHVTTEHEKKEFDLINSEDEVYIKHLASARGLFCHGFPAPVSGRENDGKNSEEVKKDGEEKKSGQLEFFEVSAFDGDGHTWKIIDVSPKKVNIKDQKKEDSEKKQPLIMRQSKIQLKHIHYDCFLVTTGKVLPSWGFKQGEVACKKNATIEESTFNIEEINSLRIPVLDEYTPPKIDRTGFFTKIGDILDIQRIAWITNNRLTSKHSFQSRPGAWPILRRGISFWQSKKERRQVYLFGNPVIFWSILFGPPLYIALGAYYAVRDKRGVQSLDKEQQRRYFMILFLILGFFLHYFPFFLMDRQLFFHHYLPAHYFAILAFAAFCDHLLFTFRSVKLRFLLMIAFSLFCLYGYWYFSGICYSTPIPKKVKRRMKWLKTWDFM